MSDTPETTTASKIPPRAGLMRGVRLWADPDGILESPFDEDGMKMGYVYVYGEESPAVFDGKTWHSVIADGGEVASETISNQYYKIIEHAGTNEAYEELAKYITGAA